MMKNSRIEKDRKIEDNITKDVRNLFKIVKEIDHSTVNDITNLFRLKKEKKKAIKKCLDRTVHVTLNLMDLTQ